MGKPMHGVKEKAFLGLQTPRSGRARTKARQWAQLLLSTTPGLTACPGTGFLANKTSGQRLICWLLIQDPVLRKEEQV